MSTKSGAPARRGKQSRHGHAVLQDVVHISRSCPFASAHDLLRLELQEPAALDRWMGAEERKLAAPKWQGTRNHTVFANDLTIRQSLERAHLKYPGMGLQELNHIRFQRGHATTTSF